VTRRAHRFGRHYNMRKNVRTRRVRACGCLGGCLGGCTGALRTLHL